MNGVNGAARFVAGVAMVALAGCSYVKKEDYESQLAALQSSDASLRRDLDALQSQVSGMASELERRFAGYDAKISELQGRVRVDMTAHFDYDEATIREEDKPALDDFAEVLRNGHQDVVVTVEGFTDPAGSASYNARLGMRRAEAVRDYLVTSGGLDAGKIRAVSYGEARNRQIEPGAWGDNGMENRRVALVIDFAGLDAASAGTTGGATGSR